MSKVLIAAGGSGGHIFPAMALGRSLRSIDKDIDIMYVGSEKALDRRIFEKEGVCFKMLSANKLAYKISPASVIVLIKLIVDMFRALLIVLTYKPDVAVGFGGYVSFPIIFVSGLLGVPTIAHEQNVLPGRANKVLFKLAKKIAVSFEDTKKVIGKDAGKAIFTGNPIRVEMFEGNHSHDLKCFGLDEKKFTILVIGGSQGAGFINRAFMEAVSLMNAESRRMMQVIHITGVKDYEWAIKTYTDLGMDCRVHSFIDRIEEAYSAADIVVTRSGASVIFELAFLGKPMVLIPYPMAMNHQLDNALAFSEKNAAVLIEGKDLNSSAFRDLILNLLKDEKRLKALGEAAGRLAVPQASDNLARETIALSEG